MNNRKLKFHIILLLASILIGLICELGYGKFQHERYWNVTIYRVQLTQIEYVDSFFKLFKDKEMFKSTLNKKDFEDAFKPLNKKTPVWVYKDNDTVPFFTNEVKEFKIRDQSIKEIQLNNYKIVLGTYQGPNWISPPHGVFWDWIGSPLQWLEDRFIIITVPFLTFTLVFYLIILALALRTREKYLSDKVLISLELLKKDRLGA